MVLHLLARGRRVTHESQTALLHALAASHATTFLSTNDLDPEEWNVRGIFATGGWTAPLRISLVFVFS